jgi:recombination protein RecT
MSTTAISPIDVARQNIGAYKGELLASLPSHLADKGVGWLTSALSALRKNPEVLKCANQDPGSLIVALSEAAQKGLMPGTDEYYLTPKGGKILGVVGYQGEVELMYRAGAVSSVIVENVFANDKFEWNPGTMTKPVHGVDWFGGDRGQIIGSYAYAIMKDGAVSKVVIVNQERIDRAKKASATAGKSFSPWTSDEAAMILKTAAHDLAKWVPTSAEYIREQVRAVRDVANEPVKPAPEPKPEVAASPRQHHPEPTANTVTGELVDEGETSEADAAWFAKEGN